MKAKIANFKGRVSSRDQAAPLLQHPGDIVLVVRGTPRMLVMRCPSGCGDDLIINLDRRIGYAWRLYEYKNRVTLYPSYWREDGCRSHFILWNDQIYWCDGWESEESDTWLVASSVEESVFAALPADRFTNYEDLAEELGLVPWETQQACRQLVRQGRAISGAGKKRNEFRKTAR